MFSRNYKHNNINRGRVNFRIRGRRNYVNQNRQNYRFNRQRQNDNIPKYNRFQIEGNQYRRNTNSNNNRVISNKLKNIDEKISTIKKNNENKMDKFRNNKSNKELRRDRITTALTMGLTSKFLSIFPTSNRITYQKVYNRFETYNTTWSIRHFIWFPYAVNFTSYPDFEKLVFSEDGELMATKLSNFIVGDQSVGNPDLGQFSLFNTTQCGVPGMYRIICASLKITNTTSMVDKAGSYMIYKINENSLYPPFYTDTHAPTVNNSPNYKALLQSVMTANHDQINVKQSYSASEVGLIHEFNIYEGNNIFQNYSEYLGEGFDSSIEGVLNWKGNPMGNNIKYQIDIPATTAANNYIIETWQILEVVPHPTLNLDNITSFQNGFFNKNVLDKLRTYNPLKVRK